jgi:hypothetical protein
MKVIEKSESKKNISPEVLNRITGNYERDRKICSSHKHSLKAVSPIK